MAAAERNRTGNLLGLLIGMGTGFAVGRSTLTTFENLAFRVFLELDGDFFEPGDVFSSRIFWKLAIGTGFGGLAGFVIGGRMGAAALQPGPVPPPAQTYH